MAVSLEDIINEFSDEDKEFNRRMVDAGNRVSGTIRRNLNVGSLRGKALCYNAATDEEDNDFASKVLENY